MCTVAPVAPKGGYVTTEDIISCPKGVHIRGIPLYSLYNVHV